VKSGKLKVEQLPSGSLVVINLQHNNKDDLRQDFVSLITSFTVGLYGLRRSNRKIEQLIKELERK
jgi:predicted site-specific integrase-resolvase